MEGIVGQIESDILGEDKPAVLVSPAGGVVRNPQAPAVPLVPVKKKSPVDSALVWLKKPAGPLPIYGWGLVGFGAVGAIATIVSLSKRRGYRY